MNDLLAYGPLINTNLESWLRAKEQTMSPTMPLAIDFLDRLRVFATGGKVLRGCTLCFSYAMCSNGQPPIKAVIQAAMALELTHSALLMHDDVMDEDAVRRGQPSLHRQYQTVAQEQDLARAGHFGESMAICSGDAAFFLAFELLSEALRELKPQATRTINRLFTQEFASVSAGQMQDMYLEASRTMPTRQAIYDMMLAKTAAYTLALPLAIGALFAHQSSVTVQTLQSIGLHAGTIFQIRDDELGSLGTRAKLGKPVGADIRKGKKTLLAYYLFKRCTPKDRTRLMEIFGNPKASAKDIATFQELARHYTIPEVLNREVSRLHSRASAQIARLTVTNQAKIELENLVRFCADRQA